MRGDETRPGTDPGAESRESRGPLHAAPRKSLLSKVRIPVGKTMALAAMPTAVFVGMGMAPRPAVADDQELPFAPGPCVTRSDEPAHSPSPAGPAPAASSPAAPSGAATSPGAVVLPRPGVSPSAPEPPAGKPVPSPTGPGTGAGTGTGAPGPGSSPGTSPATPPAPSGSADARDPRDPLGTGEALKGLFDALGRPLRGGRTTPAAAPARTPDPLAEAIRAAARGAGLPFGELSDEVRRTATVPKDETGGAADDPGEAGEADGDPEEAGDQETDDPPEKDPEDTGPGPGPGTAPGATAGATPGATPGAGGKQPYPCPTYDAKALAEARLEQGIPLLPDEPWYLDSTRLTLYGLDYRGIVEVRTASGRIKKVLKFTADALDIEDLHQTVGKGADTAHLRSRPGSTSKIQDATVTMYTESLKGTILGLFEVEFTPNSPPPLNLPYVYFTDVHVVQAGQFGGTLTVPGLRNYIGPPE